MAWETRKKAQAVVAAAVCAAVGWMSNVGLAQKILPFTESPSKSVAGRTLQESKHQLQTEPQRLPKDAPTSSSS